MNIQLWIVCERKATLIFFIHVNVSFIQIFKIITGSYELINRTIRLMSRGSIPGRVIPKTQKKWYLMPPCSTLSIIRYRSRVNWINLGNGVASSSTPRSGSNLKEEPSGHPRLRSPTLLYYELIEKKKDPSSALIFFLPFFKLNFMLSKEG